MIDLYADASALTKLAVSEAESDALAAYVADTSARLASSSLILVELTRAVRVRGGGEGARPLAAVLRRITVVPVDDAVLALAARLADARLRSLDAIHLASALTLGVERMLVYDSRLAEAAEAAGIEAVAPGVDDPGA